VSRSTILPYQAEPRAVESAMQLQKTTTLVKKEVITNNFFVEKPMFILNRSNFPKSIDISDEVNKMTQHEVHGKEYSGDKGLCIKGPNTKVSKEQIDLNQCNSHDEDSSISIRDLDRSSDEFNKNDSSSASRVDLASELVDESPNSEFIPGRT
jgi:hypothetical protein